MAKKHKEKELKPQPGEEGGAEEFREEEQAEAEAESGPSLEEELAASREEARKNYDLYLRERAGLENFRKRAQRDKEDLARFGNENIIREILPVLDNLERAVDHARQDPGGGEGLLEGVEMTLSQFHRALDKFGAIPFAAAGEAFDPARHEAMGQLESAEHAPNTVVQELQKGYLLNERLLRPALVMVAKAPAEATPEAEEND